jgi:hypothetical protein
MVNVLHQACAIQVVFLQFKKHNVTCISISHWMKKDVFLMIKNSPFLDLNLDPKPHNQFLVDNGV